MVTFNLKRNRYTIPSAENKQVTVESYTAHDTVTPQRTTRGRHCTEA